MVSDVKWPSVIGGRIFKVQKSNVADVPNHFIPFETTSLAASKCVLESNVKNHPVWYCRLQH